MTTPVATDGFNIDQMFTTGDARIFIGDGTTTITKPTIAAIKAHMTGGTKIAGLIDLGDTKIDESITFEEEAAEYTNKGTLQHRVLKEIQTKAPVSSFKITSVQPRSGRILKWYYGGGTEGAGFFDTPLAADSKPIEVPALLVLKDGTDLFPGFAPRASIKRAGPITFPIDDYAEVPLQGTILDPQSGSPFTWYSDTFKAA